MAFWQFGGKAASEGKKDEGFTQSFTGQLKNPETIYLTLNPTRQYSLPFQ